MNEVGESSEGNSDPVLLHANPFASSSVISISPTEEEPDPIPPAAASAAPAAGGDSDAPHDNDGPLKSILKTSSAKSKRSVKFADNNNQCLVTYQEPCTRSQWNGVQSHTNTEILESYFKACSKVHTVVQDIIADQLREIRNNMDYSATLNLTGFTIDSDVIETLEIIFKMVTFRTIYLDKCTSTYVADILDMLEFYDPATEIVMTDIVRDDKNMWLTFATVVANSKVLVSTSFREMCFADHTLRTIFDEGVNCNSNFKRISFDGCGLSRAPTFMLGHHLKSNEYLSELHLCYLDLFSKEADIIGKFLSRNTSLRILNLSNNKIGDHGFEVLSYGLFEQAQWETGLEVLMLINNNLTQRCVDTLGAVITSCPHVQTLNVGLNNLTDLVIYETKDSLEKSLTLRALGLQSTLLTCQGIVALKEICEKNSSLRHLNLRGNKAIQPRSLNILADVIHKTSLIQIDLDDNNRSCSNPQKYVEIVNKVRQVIAINKTKVEEAHPEEYQKWSQEVFLNCEPAYVPKTFVRTTPRAASLRHRFSVQPVSEVTTICASTTSSVTHRFTVVPSTSVASNDSETTSKEVRETSESNFTITESSLVEEPLDMHAAGDAGSLLSLKEVHPNSSDAKTVQSRLLEVAGANKDTENALSEMTEDLEIFEGTTIQEMGDSAEINSQGSGDSVMIYEVTSTQEMGDSETDSSSIPDKGATEVPISVDNIDAMDTTESNVTSDLLESCEKQQMPVYLEEALECSSSNLSETVED